MSRDPIKGEKTPTLTETLLLVVFREQIKAPDLETGIAHLVDNNDHVATADEWRAAVAEAVAAGYIHDPIRLPAGALQCHWHLALTATGVELARRLRSSAS